MGHDDGDDGQCWGAYEFGRLRGGRGVCGILECVFAASGFAFWAVPVRGEAVFGEMGRGVEFGVMDGCFEWASSGDDALVVAGGVGGGGEGAFCRV